MLGFLSFLAFAFSVAFVVSVVLLVVRSIRHKPRKPFVILAVVSVAAVLGLSMPISSMYVPPEKPAGDSDAVAESAEQETSEPPSVTSPVMPETSNVDNVDKPVDKPISSEVTETANGEQSTAPAETAPAEDKQPAAPETANPAESKKPVNSKEPHSGNETDAPAALSDLVYNGEPVTDVAVRDLVSGYDYIRDVAYVIDEDALEVRIAVVVVGGSNDEVVKKAGDKAARYLASLSNFACSDYASPSSDNLGGIFDRYSLLIYVDDGSGGIDAYGAKVPSSPVISW